MTVLAPASDSATPSPTFEWDACDRVVAINVGAHRTEFGYDGNGARVHVTETENGAVVSNLIYADNEERNAASGQVLRRLFNQGEQRNSGVEMDNYFYVGDHLDSLREFTDGNGNVQASYSYGLWGERAKQNGSMDTDVGFAEYWHHVPRSSLINTGAVKS